MPGRVVVVGGGIAALRTVEAARRAGCEDEVVLLSAEQHLPYDRPPLSKTAVTSEADVPALATAERLVALGVRWLPGQAATSLDLTRAVVRTAAGIEHGYDALVVATGVRARRLPEGMIPDVQYLRTWDDCVALRQLLPRAHHVTILGASFLGLELAASLRRAGHAVVVVEPAERVMSSSVPAAVGQAVLRLHTAQGVLVRTGLAVSGGARSADGLALSLADGSVLTTDLVVAAVGAVPNTEWLAGSGLEVADGVVCDEFGQASDSRVYAVGDVARMRDAQRRTEHWSNAGETARAVGHNLAQPHARQSLHGRVPYFWSDHFDAKLQALGDLSPTDDLVAIEGDVDGSAFVALTHREGRVTGAIGLSMPGPLMRCRSLVASALTVEDALATTSSAAVGTS